MADVIVVQKEDNSVSVIYTGASRLTTDQIVARRFANSSEVYQVVDSSALPTQSVLFDAWVYDETNGAVVDISRAKNVAHNIRRYYRTEEMQPYDDIIAKQIPGEDATDAEAQRVLIRTKYATKQTEIDACTTVEQLQTIIDEFSG
jgi:hypothetical protein